MILRKEVLVVSSFAGVLFLAAYFEWQPVNTIMDWKAKANARGNHAPSVSDYNTIDHSDGSDPFITVDFKSGKHFWHPQIAIWLEDSIGNYLETLVVTTSTARGLFYSGRSANNFMQFDNLKNDENAPTRRVDALPVWSHKKGTPYYDGFFSPPPDQPLPDGITMATPAGNFILKDQAKLPDMTSFRVMVELNVAFDENEYYSEYDFAGDSIYHGGTGLLGQPSIIYSVLITNTDDANYYVLKEFGHGHHSGADGSIDKELDKLTTARHVTERIVVGINRNWYQKED
jgi:hypothetical protein